MTELHAFRYVQIKVCQHCQESFPGISEDELELHEQSHRVCPFCTLIFDDGEQQAFEDHVYSHEDQSVLISNYDIMCLCKYGVAL